MAAISLKIVMALFLGGLLATTATTPPPEYAPGDEIPLADEDLRQITAQVLRENPMLASSPGIKYARAHRSVHSRDVASVIFYPHSDSAGIKEAFQVSCGRKPSDKRGTAARPRSGVT